MELPRDVAACKGHTRLLRPLEPVLLQDVPADVLSRIQANIHDVIRGRADEFVREDQLRLHELEPLLEIRQAPVYFAAPGMHGGFSYTLEADGEQSRLVVESWCRLAGGPASGMWCPPRGGRWLTKGSSECGEGRVAIQRLRDRVAPRRARDNIPRCLCSCHRVP